MSTENKIYFTRLTAQQKLLGLHETYLELGVEYILLVTYIKLLKGLEFLEMASINKNVSLTESDYMDIHFISQLVKACFIMWHGEYHLAQIEGILGIRKFDIQVEWLFFLINKSMESKFSLHFFHTSDL
ncbi:hypothetical protein ACJX0J_039577, partial [Zea mays]